MLDARDGSPARLAGVNGTRRDQSGRLVLGDIISAFNGKKVRRGGYRLAGCVSACNTSHSSSAHMYVCNDPTSHLQDFIAEGWHANCH